MSHGWLVAGHLAKCPKRFGHIATYQHLGPPTADSNGPTQAPGHRVLDNFVARFTATGTVPLSWNQGSNYVSEGNVQIKSNLHTGDSLCRHTQVFHTFTNKSFAFY